MSRSIVPPVALEYPSGDGKPMAENDAQLAAILYGIGALRVYFESREDVYVSGDLLMYYEEGNPRVSVAPDVFVVFGVEDRVRKHYKVWEEGKGPDFVLEVASKSTWREDLGPKREVYARLGVKEYWQYDPTGEYFTPVLQGLRLAGDTYVRQLAVASPDGALTLGRICAAWLSESSQDWTFSPSTNPNREAGARTDVDLVAAQDENRWADAGAPLSRCVAGGSARRCATSPIISGWRGARRRR